MLATAGQFDPLDGLDEWRQAECANRRLPVEEAVVLGGGRELDVFCGKVDDAAVGVTDIVAAGRAVVVEVAADPALRVDEALEHARELGSFAWLDRDFAGQVTELRAAQDHHAVVAGRQLLGEVAVLTVVLVNTAMGTPFRTEVELGRAGVEGFKVGLAGNGFAVLAGDGEADAGGGIQEEVLVAWNLPRPAHFGAAQILDEQFRPALGQFETESSLGIGVAGQGAFAKRHFESCRGDGSAGFTRLAEAPREHRRLHTLHAQNLAHRRGGRGSDGKEAFDHNLLADRKLEAVGQLVDARQAQQAEGVTALVRRIDGIGPADAVGGGAGDIEAGQVVLGGHLLRLVRLIAQGGGDEDAGDAVLDPVLMALENAAVESGGGDRLHRAGAGGANVGNAAVPAGTVDDELVVGGATQGQVVETAGRNTVVAVEGAHVGAAVGGIVGDHRLNRVAAQDEVASDAIGLLAAGQFSFAVAASFKDFEGLHRQGEERQQEQGAFHGGSVARLR